eukprot:scaffold7161_cov133-Cylindrotheca_fusiformis.AAC.3
MDHNSEQNPIAPGVAVPAVAAAPKCDTLYEELLKYHNENDSSDDDSDDSGRRRRRDKIDEEMEDKKPASRPQSQIYERGSVDDDGMDDRKPAARPQSQQYQRDSSDDDDDGMDDRKPAARPPRPQSQQYQRDSSDDDDDGMEDRKPAARPQAKHHEGKKLPKSDTIPLPTSNHKATKSEEGAYYQSSYLPTSNHKATKSEEGAYYQSGLDAKLNAARATGYAGGGKKPGIVAVDEAAIHPNSVMYRAAYGRGNTPSPSAKTSMKSTQAPPGAFPKAGTPRSGQGSPTSGNLPFESRSKGMSRSPNVDSMAPSNRSRSPQLSQDVVRKPQTTSSLVDARYISPHTSLASAAPSTVIDPFTGAQHNPKFFESIDDSLDLKDPPKGRSKSPKTVKKNRKGTADKSPTRMGFLHHSGQREKGPEHKRKGFLDRPGHREKGQDSHHSRAENIPSGSMPIFKDPPVPGHRTHSRTISDQSAQKRSPAPTDPMLQPHRKPVRTTGDDNPKIPPPYGSRPKDVSRAASDPAAAEVLGTNRTRRHYSNDSFDMDSELRMAMELSLDAAGGPNVGRRHGPAKGRPRRHYSNDSFDLDDELKIAMELSLGADGEGGSNLARDRGSPNIPASKHPRPRASYNPVSNSEIRHEDAAGKSGAQKDQSKQAKQEVRLMDHFSSSFADGARKKLADDEDSLADVLLALKLSSEEAATPKGKAKERSHILKHSSRPSTSVRELLQLEQATGKYEAGDDTSITTKDSSVIDLVAAGISTTEIESPSEDAEKQLRILQQIREEEERRQLEIALKASKSSSDDDLDADLRLALEVSRKEAQQERSSNDVLRSQQMAMEQFSSKRSLDPDRMKAELIQRGTPETHKAISRGQVKIVTCRGCNEQLQTPLSYALVFCTNCQTISPAGD